MIDQLKTFHQTAVKLSSHPNIQPTTYPACRLSDCPKSFVGRQQGAQESNTEPRTCNRAARRWSIELVPGRFQQLQPVSASFTPVYASLRHFVQTRPNCFSPRYASLRQFTPVYASLRQFELHKVLLLKCSRRRTPVYASLRQFTPVVWTV